MTALVDRHASGFEGPARASAGGTAGARASANHRWSAHLAGALCALVGAPATLALVLGLNEVAGRPPDDGGPREVSFHMAPPPPKPPPPRREEPPPRPAPRSAPRAALPPMPTLGAALTGVDVGLSSFAAGAALDGVADEALGDLKDVVHTEDTVDSRPVPRATTPIDVPAAARAKNLSGRVVLSLRIGADGAVKAVKVLEADPPGVFENVAVRTVRGWTFQPATYRGRPVEVWASLPIEFQP